MAIGVFIDGAYVAKVFRDRMDYVKLRQLIEQELGDTIDEAYFFNADDDPPRAQKFHNALAFPPPKGPGMRVKIYWLQRKLLWWPKRLGGLPVVHPSDETVQYELTQQKAVDVGLVFHMIRSFSKRKWTKLVLAAGDADFHEPVQYLVETENVDLFLVGTMGTIAETMRPYARKIFEIDQEPLHATLMLATAGT
jgi:uncharacterized LabA/DUF88 family protein